MPQTPYEKKAQREVDDWLHREGSTIQRAIDFATKPLDWVVRRTASDDKLDQASDRVVEFISTLNETSVWTYEDSDLLEKAREEGLWVDQLEDLREKPLEQLDPLARRFFTQNVVLSAVEGGGAGLGGALFIAADIPLLFTINLRLIQQIAASYGFPMQHSSYRFLVLTIYNAAAAGTRDAKNDAMREISVAAASIASNGSYQGRAPSGTIRDQSRNLPREIAKNLVGRKLAQTIPVAGAAVGAGINYWFTKQTAQTAYMLCRALYLEHKERQPA